MYLVLIALHMPCFDHFLLRSYQFLTEFHYNVYILLLSDAYLKHFVNLMEK